MSRKGAWGGADNSRKRKARSLPTGSGFCVPLPIGLLASPAWAATSRQTRRLVDALMIEHGEHGGEENGNLKAPYDTLQARGMRRADIKRAICEGAALGIIEATLGRRSHGAKRLPTVYRLTWLGTPDGLAATNEWKAIKTDEEARVRVENAMAALERERAIKAASRQERAMRLAAKAKLTRTA